MCLAPLGQGQCCSARVAETKSVKHGPLVCCQPRAIREPKSNPITTTSQNVQFAIRQHTPGGIDHALRHGSRLESLSQVSTPCFPTPRPDRAASSSASTDTYIVPHDMIQGIKSNLKKTAFPGIRHGTVEHPLRRSTVP
jgi:hypothetical protein